MSDEKKIEVTNQNALKLAVGLLDILVSQNKIMIDRLGVMNGILGKIASTDLGGPNGEPDSNGAKSNNV